jgi:hypothetical protein
MAIEAIAGLAGGGGGGAVGGLLEAGKGILGKVKGGKKKKKAEEGGKEEGGGNKAQEVLQSVSQIADVAKGFIK